MSARLPALLLLAALVIFFGAKEARRPASAPAPEAARAPSAEASGGPPAPAPPSRRTWGNPASLPDHFARHGADFGAKDADEYARMAWQFRERAQARRLPAKLDADGVLRVFDRQTGTFAAYNRDGTTKTFFKPGSPGYFDRQPGRLVTP